VPDVSAFDAPAESVDAIRMAMAAFQETATIDLCQQWPIHGIEFDTLFPRHKERFIESLDSP
jgi:hypothetical protein